MWLGTNKGFYSIVKIPKQYSSSGDNTPDETFTIRARTKSYLTQAFPNKKVFEYPFSDYEYRVFCTPQEVQKFLLDEFQKIDYTNFKNSVSDRKLHDFYLKVWGYGVQYLRDKIRY